MHTNACVAQAENACVSVAQTMGANTTVAFALDSHAANAFAKNPKAASFMSGINAIAIGIGAAVEGAHRSGTRTR